MLANVSAVAFLHAILVVFWKLRIYFVSLPYGDGKYTFNSQWGHLQDEIGLLEFHMFMDTYTFENKKRFGQRVGIH